MNRKDYEGAIVREVESWPGVSVEFVDGGKHPKAKLTYTPPAGGDALMVSRPFAGTPSDAAFGIHQMLGDMRRAMRQLGAERAKPAPSKDEDEAPYRKAPPAGKTLPELVKGEPAADKPDIADQFAAVGMTAMRVVGNAAEKVFSTGADLLDRAEAASDRVKEARTSRSGVPVVHQSEGEPGTQTSRSRDAREVLLAEMKARVEAIRDGIYFDLPADVYHAVRRLSASGLQKLCVSPATFWRGSWLDPDRPEMDEEQTLAQLLGKAYHTARLEPHLFETTYARTLDKSEHPDALFTADQMKAVCEDIGLKKSGTKDELADRLVDHGYVDRMIWTVEERRWEAARAGRTPLPAKHFDQMIGDMEAMKANGPIAELFEGGYAEVSIFWTDQYGIKMKQRVDYLAPRHFADLKTIANTRQKLFDQAVADAFQYSRYYVQATSYRDGVEAVRVGGVDVVEGDDAQRAFVAALRLNPAELECFYIFQEKGGVPNVIAYEFPFYMVPYTTVFNEAITDDVGRREAMRELTRNRTRIFMRGQHDIVEAKKLYVLYEQVYPAGTPWFPLEPRRVLSDEMWNQYWLDGVR